MNKSFVDFEGETNEVTQRDNKIDKKDYLPFISEVEEFNNAMGKSWQNRTTPTINKEDADFVIEFIQEELDELKEAVKEKDIVEVLDALCDICYVALGNGVMSFGLKDKFEKAYAEVQASNMSKLCKDEDTAKATVKVMEFKNKESYHYEKVDNHYVVYRTRDKKVGKSVDYFAPDLRQFFTDKEIENCKNS